MRRISLVLALLTACTDGFDDKVDNLDGPGSAVGDAPTALLTAPTGDGPWYSERIQQADDISPYRAHLAFGKHYCEAA